MHSSGVMCSRDELDHDAARDTHTDQRMDVAVGGWTVGGGGPACSRKCPRDSVCRCLVTKKLLS